MANGPEGRQSRSEPVQDHSGGAQREDPERSAGLRVTAAAGEPSDDGNVIVASEPERHEVKQLGKAGRKLWKWLVGLAGAIIVGIVTPVAGHFTDGWFSRDRLLLTMRQG